MKKILKSMMLLVAATTAAGTFVSCSDDDLPAADALFRPIINETDNIEQGLDENNVPYMIVTWDNYTSANQYTVKVEAVDGSDTKELTTSELKCRFDNLEYDKEYFVYLSSANTNNGLSSKPFSLTTTTLDYPTALASLATTDIIDTQARIKWGSSATYDSLAIIKDSNDSLVAGIALSAEDNEAHELIVRNLDPKTTYRVQAYAGTDYRGKKRFTTTAAEKYEGVVFDLRGMDESESKSYITTDQIATDVSENPDQDITYVLQGGVQYKISGGTKIPKTTGTVRFVTGLTLAGNATFLQSGGFAINAGEDVGGLTLEKIDIISDKAIEGGDNEIPANTNKGFGGRQVFNINGVKATLNNLTFKSCTITGFRAVVRGQGDGDNVANIVLEDCVINGIGDQGVFTTTNKDEDWKSISMKNCTVNNIVMLCDLRKTTGTLKFTIEDCTFCYAPIETTANANTPLFRLGSGNIELSVKNTLFGPSMASTGSTGGDVLMYTAGVVGSIFVSGTLGNINVENSYKTNFDWTDLNASGEGDPKIYPLEGLGELGISETELWNKPGEGQFGIIGKVSGVDLGKLGDNRWH